MSFIEDKENLVEILDMIFSSEKNQESYIAEEAIMASIGRDIRVVVSGGSFIYFYSSEMIMISAVIAIKEECLRIINLQKVYKKL